MYDPKDLEGLEADIRTYKVLYHTEDWSCTVYVGADTAETAVVCANCHLDEVMNISFSEHKAVTQVPMWSKIYGVIHMELT